MEDYCSIWFVNVSSAQFFNNDFLFLVFNRQLLKGYKFWCEEQRFLNQMLIYSILEISSRNFDNMSGIFRRKKDCPITTEMKQSLNYKNSESYATKRRRSHAPISLISSSESVCVIGYWCHSTS